MKFKTRYPNYSPRSRRAFQTRHKEEDRLPTSRATPQSFPSQTTFSSLTNLARFFKRRATPSINRNGSRRARARKLVFLARKLSTYFKASKEASRSESSDSFSLRSFHQEEFLPDVEKETEAQDIGEQATTPLNQPTQSTAIVSPPTKSKADQNSEEVQKVLEKWKIADSHRREEFEKAQGNRKALEISRSKWKKEEEEEGQLGNGSNKSRARRSRRLSSDPTLFRSSFESTSSRGSFFLSRLDAFDSLGNRPLVFEDLNTQIEALMEEDSNVYTVEAQDDVGVQDEEVIQTLSGANILIESQDLVEDEGATSKRDKGKQVIRNQEAEQYHVIKARLSRLLVERGSQEDDIIEEEEEEEDEEEDEDSDQTLDG